MSIVFIGIIRYKEIYYDTVTEQFRAYTTDVLSGSQTEVERKKKLMDFAMEWVPMAAPLIALLVYIAARRMPAITLDERFSVVLYVLLSAVIGTAPAIILSRKVRTVWKQHYEVAPAAGAEDREAAALRLRSENRLYTAFQFILILGIIGVPVFIRESGSLFALLGYSLFWFMSCLMLAIFRIWDRWIAEWQLHNRRVNGKGQ